MTKKADDDDKGINDNKAMARMMHTWRMLQTMRPTRQDNNSKDNDGNGKGRDDNNDNNEDVSSVRMTC